LLGLQRPQSDPPHHDELLFIVVHQVYELWFKQILHELEAAIRHLDEDDALRTTRALSRVHAIQHLLEEQIDVLETMTPHEFNAFRSRLNPASGFQSQQFRDLEYLCGVGGARPNQPTLYDALKGYLVRRGFAVASHDELVGTFRDIYEDAERRVELYVLLEAFIELDERFLLWRGRHIRMVERMIGHKPGTGGSLGVRYLQTTLEKKCFPELWEVRTILGTEAPAW